MWLSNYYFTFEDWGRFHVSSHARGGALPLRRHVSQDHTKHSLVLKRKEDVQSILKYILPSAHIDFGTIDRTDHHSDRGASDRSAL
jgi:hypothetical protein